MSGENFIYFSTVSGFFIGIIFAILKGLEPFNFLAITIMLTGIFYLIALGSVAFFIKFVEVKKIVFFNKQEIDSVVNKQIAELQKHENFILENYEFIKKVEEEELEILRKRRNAKKSVS